MKKHTLETHRKLLSENPDRYEEGYAAARSNWVRHAYTVYRQNFVSRSAKAELKTTLGVMADLVFDAQERRPLFEIDDKIFAWNVPRYFGDDYIRYEIGHLRPRNKYGTSQAANLCFQSSRCNQHIQSALAINDVLFLLRSHNCISRRVKALEDLHASQAWSDLERQITAAE